jgi:hypothetical protein
MHERAHLAECASLPVYGSDPLLQRGYQRALNHAYSFQFQDDCNLVLLTGRWQPLWSSNTGGRSCTSTNSCLALQGDELGHTLRLAHKYRDNTSAMWPVLSTGGSSTPNSNDIGSPSPGCPPRGSYGGLGGGVMCIYGWGD